MDACSDAKIAEVVVMAGAQLGKALSIDTPIATPAGWTTMGDIVPGSQVFGMDGSVIDVLGVSPVFDDRQCYEVEFSDGAIITADAEHLWYVEPDRRAPEIKTTAQILTDYKYRNRNRYAIPVAKPIDLPDVDLLIDPYLLGAWLGDGHSASARLFAAESDAEFMASQVKKAGHRVQVDYKTCAEIRIDVKLDHICPKGHNKDITGRTKNNGCSECGRIASKNYLRAKRSLALDDAGDTVMTFPRLLLEMNLIKNKHIPAKYLRASKDQRLSLLQGLMDTDGTIGTNGHCEFVTTSRAISDGFGELLYSLGIKHTVKTKQPRCHYKGQSVDGKLAWRFSFTAYRDQRIFRMPRKLDRLNSRESGRPTETFRRRIVDIREAESVPVRCILVSAEDHLFLAGKEMIPTHNTEAILNIIGYHIHHDPSPILVLQPTLDMAQAFSKDRVASGLIRSTPALRDKVRDPRARDSGNTTLHKVFPGGALTMVGANSPSGLASRPIRLVLCDEVDRYPASAGAEGDPIQLARKRAATFWNRKIVMVSTPTNDGSSRIQDAYEKSDQRKYYVPCRHCHNEQVLAWRNVRWDDGQPETARYMCEDCGCLWDESDRVWSIRNGHWIAEAEFKGIAGFSISGLYSPWTPLADGVRDFLSVKKNPEQLRVWTNTYLGELWMDPGETIDDFMLADRREEMAKIPDDVIILTAGIDVQDNRLEISIIGWGRDDQSWVISHDTMYGDPSTPQLWTALDSNLMRQFETESGRRLAIRGACVDSGGHFTNSVYNYAKKNMGRRIFAIKGVGGEGRPISGRPSKNNIAKCPLFPIGVDTAKDLLFARMRISEPGPGYINFSDTLSDEYFRQLTAEKIVTKYSKGFKKRVFEKIRPRNEALDCMVYSLAAYAIIGVNVNAFADKLESEPKKMVEKTPEKASKKQFIQPARPVGPGGFANSWR